MSRKDIFNQRLELEYKNKKTKASYKDMRTQVAWQAAEKKKSELLLKARSLEKRRNEIEKLAIKKNEDARRDADRSVLIDMAEHGLSGGFIKVLYEEKVKGDSIINKLNENLKKDAYIVNSELSDFQTHIDTLNNNSKQSEVESHIVAIDQISGVVMTTLMIVSEIERKIGPNIKSDIRKQTINKRKKPERKSNDLTIIERKKSKILKVEMKKNRIIK